MRSIDARLQTLCFKSGISLIWCALWILVIISSSQTFGLESFFSKSLLVALSVLLVSLHTNTYVALLLGLWLDLEYGAVVGLSALAFYAMYQVLRKSYHEKNLTITAIGGELTILIVYFTYAWSA